MLVFEKQAKPSPCVRPAAENLTGFCAPVDCAHCLRHFVLPTIGSSLTAQRACLLVHDRVLKMAHSSTGKNLLAVHTVMFNFASWHGKPGKTRPECSCAPAVLSRDLAYLSQLGAFLRRALHVSSRFCFRYVSAACNGKRRCANITVSNLVTQ